MKTEDIGTLKEKLMHLPAVFHNHVIVCEFSSSGLINFKDGTLAYLLQTICERCGKACLIRLASSDRTEYLSALEDKYANKCSLPLEKPENVDKDVPGLIGIQKSVVVKED